ncbi:type VII secretion target [Nocardia arizonensis]|nr:type VII secretion target [Nocardia arizonensis]
MDPARVRELAGQVRGRGEVIRGKVPMAVPERDLARTGAPQSAALTRTQETLVALDGVLGYHASRFTGIADGLERAATEFENQDQARAARFHGEQPR